MKTLKWKLEFATIYIFSKRIWLPVCDTVVVSKQIPPETLKYAQRCYTESQYLSVYGQPSSSTYRWPQQPCQCDVTLVCVYAILIMRRRLGNVQYNCANKHWSCHPFGTSCLWAAAHSASQHAHSPQPAFISSCAWPKISWHDPTNCNSCSLCRHQAFLQITPKDVREKAEHDSVFPTHYVSSLSKTWTCRPPLILSHRHLKLRTTPLLFIQALKHSSGPPNSLHYSVRLLTHKVLLTAAV